MSRCPTLTEKLTQEFTIYPQHNHNLEEQDKTNLRKHCHYLPIATLVTSVLTGSSRRNKSSPDDLDILRWSRLQAETWWSERMQ